MILRPRHSAILTAPLLLALSLVACHKEEQAVAGVAKDAEKAEHQAQAAASERDQERAELDQIPLPTKSLYVNVHDPGEWQNPFLVVNADTVALRIVFPDTNPDSGGPGSLLRPAAARRQQMQIRLPDLDKAVGAIPPEAWPYGRVIAVAESSTAAPAERPAVRRNVESVIHQLNELGVVVEEWPAR